MVDQVEILVKMAKFRNVVVPDYDQVDAEIVIGILQNRLKDFVTFKDAVVAFINKDISPSATKLDID